MVLNHSGGKKGKGYTYVERNLLLVFGLVFIATILMVIQTEATFLIGIILDVSAMVVLFDTIHVFNEYRESRRLAQEKHREERKNGKDNGVKDDNTLLLGLAMPFSFIVLAPDWTLETAVVVLIFIMVLYFAKKTFWD